MIDVYNFINSDSQKCNCCKKKANIEIKYGMGEWPVNITIIRFCEDCAKHLFNKLGSIVDEDMFEKEVVKYEEKIDIKNDKNIEESFKEAEPSEKQMMGIECE